MFPEYFWTMVMAVVIVFGLGLALFAIGWRAVDWITPGTLAKELLGVSPPNEGGVPHPKSPNVALAIVVGAMLLGLALILSATIIGVLVH